LLVAVEEQGSMHLHQVAALQAVAAVAEDLTIEALKVFRLLLMQ
jgi:hypothetical protein